MKKLSLFGTLFGTLFGALAALVFSVACGSNNGNSFPPPTGNFSNASLSGQYAYQLTGIDSVSTFREAGVFTADGSGHITSGADDFAQGTTISSGSSSGSYSISGDGTGTATLNVSDGRSLGLAVTIVSSSKVYLLVANTQLAATGTGVAEKQVAAAFAAPPSGTFVFRMHTIGTAGSAGAVGAIAIASGVVTGNEDVNTIAAFTSSGLTGLFNFPDSSGHGNGTFTDDSNVTSSFFYYVIDADTFLLFSSDAGIQGLGRAEKQSGAPFSAASLSGGYVFGSRGDTRTSLDGVNTVGQFGAMGDGTIPSGVYDFVQDGTSFASINLAGTYTMDASGRAVVTLTPSNTGTNIEEVVWMVSPSRAFYVINDPNKVEEGSLDLQQVATFSNSTMNGQFVVVMNGFDPTSLVSRVGTLQWDGAGNLQLNEFLNRGGTVSIPGLLPGTYSVSSNGRTTGIINSLSSNLVFYLVSGNDAYVLQNDAGTQIDGTMSKQ
jgi:hypothetical protein